MTSPISIFVDTLAEGIHETKCRNEQGKKCERCGIKNKNCECCL